MIGRGSRMGRGAPSPKAGMHAWSPGPAGRLVEELFWSV